MASDTGVFCPAGSAWQEAVAHTPGLSPPPGPAPGPRPRDAPLPGKIRRESCAASAGSSALPWRCSILLKNERRDLRVSRPAEAARITWRHLAGHVTDKFTDPACQYTSG